MIAAFVSDPARSRRFYEQALAPLGYKVIMQTPIEHTGGLVVLGLGVPPMPDFWLYEGTPQKPHIHVAIRAANRPAVDPRPRWAQHRGVLSHAAVAGQQTQYLRPSG